MNPFYRFVPPAAKNANLLAYLLLLLLLSLMRHKFGDAKFYVFDNIMTDIIEFNVGGQIFASTYQTIGVDKKSLLYTWYFERKGSAHTMLDKKGRFFIDRDPTSFGIILNYLRLHNAKQLCEVCLPKEPDRLALLTQEAEFFRLPSLRDQAVALLRKCTAEEPSLAEIRGQMMSLKTNGGMKNGRRWKSDEDDHDNEDD
ncbi:hypothetical protein niasHS_005132 [Heterodera schachtii]|uniref:Potassium channel tetramerisation-type BTB domain-containing protein n=1 Tax=Heterodera schachtii TaxID=97005 RepID=A0ABD2JTR9_HETSC